MVSSGNGFSEYSDGTEPDRVGRMGGRRSNTVNGQIARHMRGYSPRGFGSGGSKNGREGGGGRGAGGGRGGRSGYSGSNPKAQRVVVKAHYTRHVAGKAKGSLTRHASYLARESASADGKPGQFYNAQEQGMETKAVKADLAQWADDRHHFRIIISPENAHELPDMTAYVRDVMKRVERDLGTRLDWIGINHHNTDNPHAHVMIRGVRDNGKDLVMQRRYIAHGLRERASEVATLWLGERSVDEIKRSQEKEVKAERWTYLDRAIERNMYTDQERGNEIWTFDVRSVERHNDTSRLVKGRLAYLASLGLVSKGKGTTWIVEDAFKEKLQQLGARNDIIKQLYSSMGVAAGGVERFGTQRPEKGVPVPIEGVVVAKGAVDEISSSRFIVLRAGDGRDYYTEVADGYAFQRLKVGSVAQIGQQAQRRYALTQEIMAVAGPHQNTYSAVEHMNYLRQQHPQWSEEMREARVRSAVGQMHFLAGFEKSGVVAPEEGKANRFNPTYGVIPDQLERFMSRPQAYTDLRALSPYTLEEQAQAHAVTWLDRQILRPGHEMEQNPGGAVAHAIEQRKTWLIEQGYAHRTADGKNIAYEHGALQYLAATEQQSHFQGTVNEYGKPARMLEFGQTVEGVYRGWRVAHEGAYGIVETAEAVYLAKTNRGLSHLHVGKTVQMDRDGRDLRSRELTLPELGRSRSRDRDLELGL